jgi:hypothetical protein
MKCNLKTKTSKETNKNCDTSKALASCHLLLFGHRTADMRTGSSPFPDWRAPLSPTKRNKQKTNLPAEATELCVCLRGFFLDMRPFFVFWKDIFTWGEEFGSPVTHQVHFSFFKPEIVAHSCWQ